jgi:pyruvate dehydrogenase E1 component
LQHQDGQSHLLAYPAPHVKAYDPAFAYEIAVILRDGIRRMYVENEDVIYYLTVANENYVMPPMPKGCEEGILAGMYRFAKAPTKMNKHVHLLGSGAILRESLRAAEILASSFEISADVWSVTSYKNLHRDGLETDRYNRLHPSGSRRVPYVTKMLGSDAGVVVAASDYIKALPCSIAKWIPGEFQILGTDGFGRSDDRKRLRHFFEVSAEHIAAAALFGLVNSEKMNADDAEAAIAQLGIDPEIPDPFVVDAGGNGRC